jgi:hypothetical protein
MTDQELFAIKRRAARAWLQIPGVHGVGIGPKLVGGQPTGELALVVFVDHKQRRAWTPLSRAIPRTFEGLPTDLDQSARLQQAVYRPGYMFPQNTGAQTVGDLVNQAIASRDKQKYRPLKAGTGLSAQDGVDSNGTITGFFKLTNPGQGHRRLAMTNQHVLLPDVSAAVPASPLLPVGQPNPTNSCSGCTNHQIGTLTDAIPSAAHSSGAMAVEVDVALVDLHPGIKYVNEVLDLGPFAPTTRTLTCEEIRTGMVRVQKRGITTGVTGGLVRALGATGIISPGLTLGVIRPYTNGMIIHGNPQLQGGSDLTIFALPGDSGSPVLDDTMQLVGVLFGAAGNAIEPPACRRSTQPGGEGYNAPLVAVMPIADVFRNFSAAGLDLELDTASGEQTVASAAGASPPEHLVVEERLRRDLDPRGLGGWYTELYVRHSDEIADLLSRNREVGHHWHRSGAAAFYQSLVRAFHDENRRVIDEVDGVRPERALAELHEILRRHGSEALRADLEQVVRGNVPPLAGQSYRELVESLNRAPYP